MTSEEIKTEVWNTIQTMNRLWTVDNKPEALVRFFHKNMVAITPSDKFRVEGQAACVKGWKDFCQMAVIHHWKEIDPKIDLYGDNQFAIVTYHFEMQFEVNKQTIEMQGRDMFALVKEDNRWQVVADQFSAMP
jgi:ketosteroid isomerase-like protein